MCFHVKSPTFDDISKHRPAKLGWGVPVVDYMSDYRVFVQCRPECLAATERHAPALKPAIQIAESVIDIFVKFDLSIAHASPN